MADLLVCGIKLTSSKRFNILFSTQKRFAIEISRTFFVSEFYFEKKYFLNFSLLVDSLGVVGVFASSSSFLIWSYSLKKLSAFLFRLNRFWLLVLDSLFVFSLILVGSGGIGFLSLFFFFVIIIIILRHSVV